EVDAPYSYLDLDWEFVREVSDCEIDGDGEWTLADHAYLSSNGSTGADSEDEEYEDECEEDDEEEFEEDDVEEVEDDDDNGDERFCGYDYGDDHGAR
ncbi:hypothetical protein KC319_g17061, partial [Hortaea werneckii]